jgi:hypothetical protein
MGIILPLGSIDAITEITFTGACAVMDTVRYARRAAGGCGSIKLSVPGNLEVRERTSLI